jgi:hypothetical protein
MMTLMLGSHRIAGVAALASMSLLGCRPTPVNVPATMTIAPPPAPGAPMAAATSEPAILSAHLEAVDLPSLDRHDALDVLFSSDLDAASLEPSAFMVMFSDGSRVVPSEARLAPASENDENRTVVLIGDFGDPKDRPPTDVMVVGRVYGELGESFEGLVAKVDPFDAAGRPVVAELVPVDDDACMGLGQAIRTWWTDGLRGVEAADLAEIHIELEDGTVVTPVKFDDHDLEDQRREDNVLDLCLTETSPARGLEFGAGLFEDPAGHPSAAVSMKIGSEATSAAVAVSSGSR